MKYTGKKCAYKMFIGDVIEIPTSEDGITFHCDTNVWLEIEHDYDCEHEFVKVIAANQSVTNAEITESVQEYGQLYGVEVPLNYSKPTIRIPDGELVL